MTVQSMPTAGVYRAEHSEAPGATATPTGNGLLPIDLKFGLKLDARLAREIGEELSGEYCFAEPFPHIVIDNFLPDALSRLALDHFPTQRLESDPAMHRLVFAIRRRLTE